MSAIENISLFVPHVFPNFTQKYVANSFAILGDIDCVDFIAKQDRDGKPYNAAYIHFKRWYDNRTANQIKATLESSGKTEFYHDNSEYYWIVLPNKAKKYLPGHRKPRLDLGQTNSISVKSIEKKPDKSIKENVCECALFNNEIGFEKSYHYCGISNNTSSEEIDAELQEIYTEMEDIDSELQAEDSNLITIDHRYIQTIEQENMCLRAEIAQLRMALINLDHLYQAEKAKVTAFSNVALNTDM